MVQQTITRYISRLYFQNIFFHFFARLFGIKEQSSLKIVTVKCDIVLSCPEAF